MKDGGSDMGRMLTMLEIIGECNYTFDYYPSSTSSLITGFLLGVNSCISGVSLTVPRLALSIYNAMIMGQVDHAVDLYRDIMKVRAVLGARTSRAIAAYHTLQAKGVDVGICRAPWESLNDRDEFWLFEELLKLEII